jgi:tRNA1(Val) A37 N6-methylase TrmN6
MRSRQSESGKPRGGVTDDAFLGRRLRLLQPVRGHRAGHDAMLLAAAAPAARHAVDLGAGVGAAGLALLARGAAERATLVEIDAALCELARANCERNGLADRTNVVAADATVLARRGGPPSLVAASADLVIANPPFNDPERRQTSPHAGRRRAHAGRESNLRSWIAAAERLLEPGGSFVLIHRPEALPAILAALEDGFGAIELIPIHALPHRPAIRLIVRARKGRRTTPILHHGFVLADAAGTPTPAAEAVLRNAAPLDPA